MTRDFVDLILGSPWYARQELLPYWEFKMP